MIYLYIFLLFAIVRSANTCGASTHISIAHEAATFYQSPLDARVDYASIIRKHSDAFVAGNPYPDAMYPSLCFGGKYHETSEDSHWAPFLNATVNYIRKNYPQPWDQDTEKLVAFMFGYISHQVADITWHSLAGFEQGFLRVMANVNFHGVFDTAHTDGDVGGDMLTQYDNADKVVGITKWYVPVDDLYEIYQEFYNGSSRVPPKYVIELCSQLLYLEYIAETFAGAKIFKPFVKKSPFLLNQLDNYFLGGIHDMAAWTSQIWNETVFMLEHGTSKCNMERSTIHVNCTGYLTPDKAQKAGWFKRNPGRLYPLQNAGWNLSHVEKIRTKRGVYFVPGNEMEMYLSEELKRREGKRRQLTTTQYSYAQIGKSLTEIEIQAKNYLVVGAPTYSESGMASLGKVWIIPADKFFNHQSSNIGAWGEVPDLDAMATQVLTGSERMSRFGWSVLGTSFNRSAGYGVQDLLIGAPTTGSPGLCYKGAVHLYYGSKEGGLSPKLNRTLTMEDKSSPAAHAHTNYGYSISASSGGLLVTTPFYSGQSGLGYSPEFEEVVREGEQAFSWYGYSRAVQYRNVPRTYVSVNMEVIGSPNYRICHFTNCSYHPMDKQAVGQFQYLVDEKVMKTFTGTEEFQELGYATSISWLGWIAVSSPSRTIKTTIAGVSITLQQAGMVSLYKVVDILRGDVRHVVDYHGDRSYGRFGEVVRVADVDRDGNDELIVGAPRRTRDITEEIYGAEEGAVFIYKIPHDFHGNNADDEVVTMTTDKAWKSLIGNEENARFGSSLHLLTTRNDTRLIVGATTSSKYGFKTGLVHSFDIKNI